MSEPNMRGAQRASEAQPEGYNIVFDRYILYCSGDNAVHMQNREIFSQDNAVELQGVKRKSEHFDPKEISSLGKKR